ncbi:MAG: hypothetical protein NTU91_07780 [Chloroflexi bacterium]|nr:hypothetical protein [Chloroflexota bacterium]
MNAAIEGAPRRPVHYWYDDGLAEIGVGLLFLVLAALFAVEGRAPAGSLPPWFSALGLPVVVVSGMIVLGLSMRAVKERLTYPRTGYVSYPRTGPARKWLAGVIGGGVSFLLVLFLAARPDWMIALPALQGAAVAVVFLLLSFRSGVLRLALQGVLALATGLIVSFVGVGTSVSTALVFGSVGLASLISGLLVLAHYLRTTAPPAGAA